MPKSTMWFACRSTLESGFHSLTSNNYYLPLKGPQAESAGVPLFLVTPEAFFCWSGKINVT